MSSLLPFVSFVLLKEAFATARSTTLSLVPRLTTPAQVWSLPQATSGTTNDRRKEKAKAHRLQPFGPASGSAAPRGPHRLFPSMEGNKSKNKGKFRAAQPDEHHAPLHLLLYPLPVCIVLSASLNLTHSNFHPGLQALIC